MPVAPQTTLKKEFHTAVFTIRQLTLEAKVHPAKGLTVSETKCLWRFSVIPVMAFLKVLFVGKWTN